MKRKNLVPAIALLGVLAAAEAMAQLSDDNRCTRGLFKADAKFEQCMAGNDYRAPNGHVYRIRYAGCLEKYAAAWDDLQSLAGTECEGPRWEDNLDGTVTDHLTGLIWEMKGNGDGVQNLADPHDADNIYQLSTSTDNLDDGTAYTSFLAALNAGGGFAGSSGWRLPTAVELSTIVTPVANLSDFEASLDPIFGPAPTSDFDDYLSTSGFAGESNLSVLVHFDGSLGRANGFWNIPAHARAVRGGR